MGYLKTLSKKVWWILIALAFIPTFGEIFMTWLGSRSTFVENMINSMRSILEGLIFWAFLIWFLVYFGYSKILKLRMKILYFVIFYFIFYGLNFASFFLVTFIVKLMKGEV